MHVHRTLGPHLGRKNETTSSSRLAGLALPVTSVASVGLQVQGF